MDIIMDVCDIFKEEKLIFWPQCVLIVVTVLVMG